VVSTEGKPRMGRTSIDVDEDVHGELKKLKGDLRLRTHGDVVRMLLDHYHGRGPAAGSDDDDGDVRRMEEEDEEAEEKKQLLFFSQLKEEPKAIKYFTGLSEQCMDWVMKTLSGVVRASSLFFVFRVRGQRPIVCSHISRDCACLGLTSRSAARGQAQTRRRAPFEQRDA
jgi:hypothetical protein